MAILEQDKVFYSEESNGDKTIFLPITRANNVEGLGRSANTAYSVGDVVYADSNKKVSLKCITLGTTSANELDISSNNIGDTVTDGSVVWQVCNRTSDVTSVNGSVGDVVIDDYVSNASISGRVITLTKADGTTITLTTQDTDTIANQVPNYSAGVSYSCYDTVASFTAPSDGVIITDMVEAGCIGYVTINGVDVRRRTQTNSSVTSTNGMYLVKQGDMVTAYTEYQHFAPQTITFYPYR